MAVHVMTSSEAVAILEALAAAGVAACVGGGWGIDALLRAQTREHSDLDLWLPATDLEPLIAALAEIRIDRLFPWPGDRPWNFVVHDGGSRRVDLHLYEPLPDGSFHYGSVAAGHRFPATALEGEGVIAATAVRCEAPEWSLRWHSDYAPRPVDRHDVPLLCARVGLALPPPYEVRAQHEGEQRCGPHGCTSA
ncbi:MAG: lincosamide nucleotidyltransferase [Acidimicrobiaceae bacterium]|jgi:lincosamide nucleotidyltransferase A/C/D/E|nr:lincosamide nucleotidyltransferase [Acidimicrobiaceae bacterium]